MGKDLVVLSGGLDSTTVLAFVDERAKLERQVFCISFDYGQRHSAEIFAARRIADHYGYPWTKVTISLGKGGVLMKHDSEMPHQTYEELHEAEGPSPTYVPFRNGTFLSHATSYALQEECDTVWAGMHADDAHNWAYPDCTPEFIGAMQNAIYVGTYHQVRLMVPFQYLTKAEVVSLGADLDTPFNLTMSCYEGTIPACGKCPTCVSRMEAFNEAGIVDPIKYEEA